MDNITPYLTQYCNVFSEWKRNGCDIDNVTEEQRIYFIDLQKKAIVQSGLSINELTLIALCRHHNSFKKVYVYLKRLINF